MLNTLTKGEKNRFWAMIEDVAAEDGPAKLEAYFTDGSSFKAYKVGDIIRIDIQPLKKS